MDKLSFTLLLLNIVILYLTILWASRDKGYEPKIAVLMAVGGMIAIIFDNSNQKKDEVLYKNQLEKLENKISACNEENSRLSQKIVQLGDNNTTNTITNTAKSGNNNAGSGQQNVVQGDNINSNTGSGNQNINSGNVSKQITNRNAGNSISLIDSYGNTINVKEDEEPTIKKEINVHDLTNSGITIRTGDRVKITATGSIRVGGFLGHSTPEGIQCYMCEQYNIVQQFKHGSLMFKRSNSVNWEYCGLSRVFTVNSPGELFFEINDNDQKNNIGYYEVEVQVYRQN